MDLGYGPIAGTCAACGKHYIAQTVICGATAPTCPHCHHYGPFKEWRAASVVDLGCGSGALLPAREGNLMAARFHSSLVSVDDHNARRREERAEQERRLRQTGVACPKCGGELLWPTPGIATVISVYPGPTTRPAHCDPCGLTVQLET